MATFLRPLSYKYQWFYDFISTLASLGVGGEKRFRNLALEGLEINQNSKILDLCCGAGQTTQFLIKYSDDVIGLDLSPVALSKAKKNVPSAKYIESDAQKLPFTDNSYDLIHTSVALHEMTEEELDKIFAEVYRVLKPQGIFTFIDLHSPHNPLFCGGLAVFMWLFETDTAWQLLKIDLPQKLLEIGFQIQNYHLYAGGSLQVIQCQKI